MKMIRICMITHDQIERRNPRADLIRFKSFAKTLSKDSNEIVFITLNDKGRYEEDYYEGSKAYKIPLLSRMTWIQIVGFCAFLLPILFRAKRRGPFDIIFINSILSVPGVVIFRWLSGYGVIQFDLMGLLSEERFLKKSKNFWTKTTQTIFSSIENYLLKRVDFITTINEKHKEIILTRIIKPVYVVRDGIFEAILERPPVSPKETQSHSKIEIIFIGQINHFRLDPLFRIMPTLLVEFPTLRLHVLGAGPQLGRYIIMAESLGLGDKVVFEGHVSHEKIFDYIEPADIAYSDDWSIIGFPMKIFEYMAIGKPVVAESTQSIKELLIDNVNALLYENESELKEKILTLARGSHLRREIGENARQMMHHHTWEKRVEALRLIYRHHLAQRGNI